MSAYEVFQHRIQLHRLVTGAKPATLPLSEVEFLRLCQEMNPMAIYPREKPSPTIRIDGVEARLCA